MAFDFDWLSVLEVVVVGGGGSLGEVVVWAAANDFDEFVVEDHEEVWLAR